MKAALNGSLNLSILDGWWAEFYDAENGWAIPTADSAGDASERDDLEADAMYDLIEHQIAPRFYDRNADGVPTRWVESIRHTLATLSPALSADRMVKEYVNRLYIPAAHSERAISASSYAPARELSEWKARLTAAWPRLQVTHVESGGVDAVPQIGDSLHVRALVEIDGLTPDDVKVEVVYGTAREGDRLADIQRQRLTLESTAPGQPATFAGTVTLEKPGSFGYNVRVVPSNPLLANPAELGLITVAH
jgi:starch phosphorylase